MKSVFLRGKHGSLLASVLVMLTVALTFGLGLGASATMDLAYARHTENSRVAKRLALSTLHKAIAQIVIDPKFSSDLDVTYGGGKGSLRFQVKNPEQIPPSTNNWEGKTPVGYGRGVPQGMIQLIATGEYLGSQKQVEMLVDLPVYPLAVACSGPVHLEGATVGSITDAQLELPLDEMLRSPLKPGHLASNSLKSPDSIKLESTSKVTGFVQSRGSIENLGAEVTGETRERWGEDAELPKLTAEEFDPKRPNPRDEEVLYGELQLPSYGDLELGQRTRRDGSLRVGGKLTLNDCILFVNGDLQVDGGLEGQGAIAVTGKVKVSGSSALRSQSRVAVVANSDIQVIGLRKESHKFQGILFSKGSISVQKVTLLGSCIQNAPPGSPANQIGVSILDANVISAPSTSGPAFDPPIDLLMPCGWNANSGKAELNTKKIFANSVDEQDVIVGKCSFRGQVSEPGASKTDANNWGSDDVFILRAGYTNPAQPEFLAIGWGRTTSGYPAYRPDGLREIAGLFYKNQAALVDEPMGGLHGDGYALQEIMGDPNHPLRTRAPNLFNFPRHLKVGLPERNGEGGYAFYGDPPGFEEGRFRDQLRQTLADLEAKRDQLRRRNSNRQHYFSLDPSRFLSRSRAVKIHYTRLLQ